MNYHYMNYLPIYHKKQQILDSIKNNQVTIIAGETGSGKTTQLPLLCLEAGRGRNGRIGCTQPRRIAAISLANYVASLYGSSTGKDVGFKVRFREKLSHNSKIKFMTDGILLAEVAGDPQLLQYDTLIIDEAHERTVNIDLIVGLLKKLLPARPDLHCVISSATIDTKLFSRGFRNAPVITVSGRLYPVQIVYKPLIELWKGEKTDSVIEGVRVAVQEIISSGNDGDILVFLPTISDIYDTMRVLSSIVKDNCLLLPLHSRLSEKAQSLVFKKNKKRKIVLSTNIAETSLTVPGVRFVIDSGFARMLRYDPVTGITRMPIERISKASAQQRAGRSGRVHEGVCIRLYSEPDFLSRPSYTTPEIKRTNLAGVILNLYGAGLGDAARFPFLQAPSKSALTNGYSQLRELGAINSKGKLTGIGKKMVQLPLDPPVSRILLYARDHGVARELMIIAAGLSVENPFLQYENSTKKLNTDFFNPESDFLSLLNLWRAVHGKYSVTRYSIPQLGSFCEKYGLSPFRIREWIDTYSQIKRICHSIPGFYAKKGIKARKESLYEAVHKSLLAGLPDGVASRVDKGIYKNIKSNEVRLYPGSALFSKDYRWLLFHDIVETSRVYGRMAAVIKPGWIEELFRQRCTRSYLEPWFDTESGTVCACEQVTFHGLILVKNRRVNLGQINRSGANDIFVKEALVRGLAEDRFWFIKHNLGIKKQIHLMEQKLRVGLYPGNYVLEAFYHERLGNTEIVNTDELSDLIKQNGGDHFLRASVEDLIQRTVPLSVDLYPDSVFLVDQPINVSYSFAPDTDNDGATLTVPLYLFNSMPLYYWEWLLPVFIRQRVGKIVSFFSTQFENKNIDTENAVDVITGKLDCSHGGFLSKVCSVIKELYDIKINISLEEIIPDHLWPIIKVIDKNGIIVESFRAFVEKPKTHFTKSGKRSNTLENICSNYEYEFHKDAEATKLPKPVDIRSGALPFPLGGFSALTVESDNVYGRIFFSKSLAIESQIAAVNYLIEQRLSEQLAWELEKFRIPPLLKQKIQSMSGEIEIQLLAEQIFVKYIIHFSDELPDSLEKIEKAVAKSCERIKNAGQFVVEYLEKFQGIYKSNDALLKKWAARYNGNGSPAVYNELHENLTEYLELLTDNKTPFFIIEKLPEFLWGMRKRIENAFLDPVKYRNRMRRMINYHDLLRSVKPQNMNHSVWKFRENLEIYIVFLFRGDESSRKQVHTEQKLKTFVEEESE